MKRLIALTVGLGALTVGAPAAFAQSPPRSPETVGCPAEHVTGEICQGPDGDSAPERCRINTWVGRARCVVDLSGGAEGVEVVVGAGPELQGSNWHAEFDVVIRDVETARLLFSEHVERTTPVSESRSPFLPRAAIFIATFFDQPAGPNVDCLVTGTHTALGAPLSPLGAVNAVPSTMGTTIVSVPLNNHFICRLF